MVEETQEQEDNIIQTLLKYISNQKEARKQIQRIYSKNPVGHHALYTKSKSRGTSKFKRKQAKFSRRINRHK